MKRTSKNLTCVISCIILLLLIFDTKCAIAGAYEGTQLCIRTVIPCLFPFMFFSTIMQNSLDGNDLRLLKPFTSFCRMPENSQGLLLTGLIGGYPVGAGCINQSYEQGQITKDTAQKLLGFCNNAGPSFIFGMLGPMFTHGGAVWTLWICHMFSAMLVGRSIIMEQSRTKGKTNREAVSISKQLENCVGVMACICGWIILFRMILSFCKRWFLWYFPSWIQVLLSGILELSNGCILLGTIPSEAYRLIFAQILLSIGGLCVLLQTSSAAGELKLSYYFPGKILQTFYSVSLSCFTGSMLYKKIDLLYWGVISLFCCLIFRVLVKNSKMGIVFSQNMRYNGKKKAHWRPNACFFERRSLVPAPTVPTEHA